MTSLVSWFLGAILILASLGVIVVRKPVHAALSFLLALLMLAALYLQLSAEFVAVMQILVYAGAILVIFMYVIVLFQDAHEQISQFKANSAPWFLWISAGAFVLALGFFGFQLIGYTPLKGTLPRDFGTPEELGLALYIDFFFPFEAVIFLFLIALIGAVYIGRKT